MRRTLLVGLIFLAGCQGVVGPARRAIQNETVDDPRYTIPPYMGHNGWISLDVAKKHSERELQPLALESYRHFALKKMLAQLPAT